MSKDMWISEWNIIFEEAMERGLSEKDAEALADKGADNAYRDRLADAADDMRMRRKEGWL